VSRVVAAWPAVWYNEHVTARTLVLLALAACGDPEVIFETEDPWQEDSDWPGIGEGKIMVTNSGDDTLSFLDPVTLEPVYRSPTGRVPGEREGPHHGAASPDGAHYFVGISNIVPGSGSGPHGSHGTGTVDGYLLRYDTATNRKDLEVRVSKSPGDVRITPDGRYVLQSHYDLNAILEAETIDEARLLKSPLAVVDAEAMERVAMIPVCPAGHGVVPSPDGQVAYVACWGSDELAIVSLAEPISAEAEVTRIPVAPGGGNPKDPTYGPYAIKVSPDGGEVWVSNIEGKLLTVYQVSSGEFDASRDVVLTSAPFFPAFSADGSRLYLPVQSPDALVTIDPADGTVLATLGLDPADCRLPHGTLVLADGVTLAMVCEGDHTGPGTVVRLSLADPDAPAVEEAFEVGVYPDDLILIEGTE
jgi:DNA-binding beta-propeller fold protein YncE